LPAKGPPVPDTEEYDGTAQRCLELYGQALERLDLAAAGAAALDLVKAVDSYIAKTAPFKRAKDPAELPVVGSILYNCTEALRIATVMLWPFLPTKVEEIWRRLGRGAYKEALANGQGAFEEWVRWGRLEAGTAIEQGPSLFPRIDKKDVLMSQEPANEAAAETAAAPAAAPEEKTITIEDFFRTQLKVGVVREAEPVPKSKKLLKLLVDVGEASPRTVVAGIALEYSPEDLVGQQVVVVANLQPAKLMGVESQGMVLAASIDGRPILVQPRQEVAPGTQVR
jgi:methionyl-tRNA synthetase